MPKKEARAREATRAKVKRTAGNDVCVCPANEEGYPARVVIGSVPLTPDYARTWCCDSTMPQPNVGLIDERIDQSRGKLVHMLGDGFRLTKQIAAAEHEDAGYTERENRRRQRFG